MNIPSTKLTKLMDYGFPRAVGHTTAALEGIKNTPNAVYIVANQDQAKQLKLKRGQFITIDSLPESIYGLKKPIVIDHYALDILVRQNNEALWKQYGDNLNARRS